MPSSHLILGHPFLLLPPISTSIRVFSNESSLCMRCPKYWSFSFSIIPSKEIPGLISFRMDWLDLLAVQGTLKSLLQYHSSKASILQHSASFTVQLSHPYMTTGKTVALTRRTLVGKVMSLLWTNKNLGNLQVRLWLWILNLWGAATLVLGRQTLADFPLDVLGPRPLSIALHSAEVKTALLSHFGCLFYFHNTILRPFPTYLVQSIFCTWSISFYKK